MRTSFDRYAGATAGFIACYLAALYIGVLHHPCWVDECRFAETARLFIAHPAYETLLHYNEMSTPLPFMLYALWGTIAGDSLPSLRIFSCIIAGLTYLLFFRFFTLIFSSTKISFLVTLFLAMNPYMIGTSVFVYTDMPAMFFLSLLLIAVIKRSSVLVCIASAGGLLCRQYFVFAVIATVLYGLWRWYVKKERQDMLIVAGSILSMLPLAVLFVLWKGTCPDNAFRKMYLAHGTAFHPAALTLYIAQLFIYLFPLVLVGWKRIYRNRWRLLASVSICWMYWLFPVTASEPGRNVGVFTVGYFNRLIRLWPGERFEQAIFFLCFTLALPILLACIEGLFLRFRTRTADYSFLVYVMIISFLCLMPFSYGHWEKYFLPLIPAAAVHLLGAFVNVKNGIAAHGISAAA